MTTKIKRGAEYCVYINGSDNSLSPSNPVAELVESELFLPDLTDVLESTLTGGVVLPITQGPNWGMIVNVYLLNVPCRIYVILQNSGTGEFKEYYFLAKSGSNIIAMFEDSLQPDEVGFFTFPPPSQSDLEYQFELLGSAYIDAYLGA